ncbi:MAG: hypothetical protein RLZZ591_2164 [Pseudomonadota bacterium]
MNTMSTPLRQALTTGCLVISSLLVPEVAFAQSIAGVVKNITGSALIVRGDKNLPVEVGTKILPGDLVRTSGDSTVGVTLKDETRLSMGANSQAALEKFAFNADSQKGGMTVSVVKGTLSMISGLLVKTNPDQVLIKTPTSTAGIRGTYFVVEVL